MDLDSIRKAMRAAMRKHGTQKTALEFDIPRNTLTTFAAGGPQRQGTVMLIVSKAPDALAALGF